MNNLTIYIVILQCKYINLRNSKNNQYNNAMKFKTSTPKKLCYGLAALLMLSCTEHDFTYKNPYEAEASELNFSTTQTVNIKLDYPNVPKGYSAAFKLYAEHPYTLDNDTKRWILRSDIKSVGSGIAASGTYSVTRDLPSYITKLYAYSENLFVNSLMEADVVNGQAIFKPALLTSVEAADSKTRSVGNWQADYSLGKYLGLPDSESKKSNGQPLYDMDEYGRPNYVSDPSEYSAYTQEITDELLNRIAATFPELVAAEEKYLADASMYLEEETEIWVGVLGDGALYENTLSYYYAKATKEELAAIPRTQAFDIKEIVAIPRAGLKEPNGIQRGEYVKLKYYDEASGKWIDKFPAGTTVGWLLQADGYTRYLKNNGAQNRYYSTTAWNGEKDPINKQHTSYFNAGTVANPFICFGFEDTDNPSGDKDANDLLFHVITNPLNATIPPVEIPAEEKDVETDDERFGYIAFEDQWPNLGDYDLNDVVVKYESTITLLQKAGEEDVYATEINDVFSLVHTGADLQNKFSYKMELTQADIAEITISDSNSSYSYDTDGKLIIDLCPNVKEAITPYALLAPADYAVYNICIKLNEGRLAQADLVQYAAPYNPFIIPVGDKEVHLPFYAPTNRADISFFGTQYDKSDIAKKVFYVSGDDNNYPFAIHLSGVDEFVIPTERISIDNTYPQYTNWVESNFQTNKDWYLHPKGK